MDLAADGDTDRPSAARIYDREVARQAVAAMPDFVVHAKVNRAVGSIVDSGMPQFLHLGSGNVAGVGRRR